MPLRKRLFIIAGANGTGKTTLAGEFLKEFRLRYLNADDFARELSGGRGEIANVRIQAGRMFLREVSRSIAGGLSFAIESTLSGRYLTKFIERVRRRDYRVSLLYIFVDNPEVSIDRIRVRVQKGGHYVPDADVIRRFWRSKRNFWNIYRSIANDWRLFYNGEKKVAEVARGEVIDVEVLDEALLKFFLERMDDK